MLELYTPLNSLTLSDALCITITYTQPCIRPWVDFYVHVNVGHSSNRWQLNSRDGPPLLRPTVCVSWQTEIRLRKDEWEPSEYAQVSGRCEKICPGHSDLMKFPMFCTAVGFCWSVCIMSLSIFLICAHTTDTRKIYVVLSLGPWCHQKVHATVWNFSLVTNQGKRGSKQLLWKKEGNR